MSNLVTLTVGQFTVIDSGDTSFGYIIRDNNGCEYNFMWDSAEDFYRDHPTSESLWEEALGSGDAFCSVVAKTDECANLIIDPQTLCPMPSDLGAIYHFSLKGYQPPA